MSTDKDINQPGLPPRPKPPEPAECCGRGCERCVYVYYEEAVLRWETEVRKLQLQHSKELAD